MSLTRADIVEQLQKILGKDRVVTDEHTLQQRSIDNFRKLQNIFGVYTMPLPAAVAVVSNTEEVSRVLAFADQRGVNVVARTGGTATEGGLETPIENSVVIDGGLMNTIIKIDAYNMQATAQCGVPLQLLEDKVRELGLTTGHSPQSKPIASMGGLVATRSIGQFSTLYGGIEDMLVGCEVVFPGGEVARIKNVPRRAAGPDIRHIVIGNEGALCFITEVTVKLFPYMPENNIFLGWTLKHMTTGFAALRRSWTRSTRPRGWRAAARRAWPRRPATATPRSTACGRRTSRTVSTTSSSTATPSSTSCRASWPRRPATSRPSPESSRT